MKLVLDNNTLQGLEGFHALVALTKGGRRIRKNGNPFPREPRHPPIEEVTLEDWLVT